MPLLLRSITVLLLVVLALGSSLSSVCMGQEPSVTTTPEPRPDDWWQNRHRDKLLEKEKLAKVDLLWIGDSITHGWESQNELWKKYYEARHPFNIGYSGDRTEHVLWRLAHGEIDGLNPRLIVIMIGTNNTGHRQDPAEQTAAGIQAIVQTLREKMPESKILLLGIFPRGADLKDPLRMLNMAINEKSKTLEDGKHIFYQDISQSFLDKDGVLSKEIMPDLLHPNAEGYRLWAEAIEPTLAKLLP